MKPLNMFSQIKCIQMKHKMNGANRNEVWERTVVVQEMLLVCGVVGKCSVRGCFGRKYSPGQTLLWLSAIAAYAELH